MATKKKKKKKTTTTERNNSTSWAAYRLGVSMATIRRWCSQGAPHTRVSDRLILINVEELRTWRTTTPHGNTIARGEP